MELTSNDITIQQLEKFIERYGRRATNTLSVLGKYEPFMQAIPVGYRQGDPSGRHLPARVSPDPTVQRRCERAGKGGIGWTIFADANGNGTLDVGEVSAVTDANGAYSLSLKPGTYAVREAPTAQHITDGWIQSSPDIPGDGDWDITLTSGLVDSGNDFGNYQNATKSGTNTWI